MWHQNLNIIIHQENFMHIERIFLGILVILLVFSVSMVFADQNTSVVQQDRLQEILSRGTLVVAINTDLASDFKVNNETARDPDSKCSDLQYAENQVSGYDVQIGSQVAKELGVDSCYIPTNSSELKNTKWGDKWDYYTDFYMTNDRLKWLFFAQPIFAVSSSFYIRDNDTSVSNISDLSGKKIGAYVQSAQTSYLNNNLTMVGTVNDNPVKDPMVIEYAQDSDAINDLVSGKVDALLFPDTDMDNVIANGTPIVALKPYAFMGYSGIAVEKGDGNSTVSFVEKLNDIVQKMHTEGFLSSIYMKTYNHDLSKDAQSFDISSLHQFNESSS